LEPIRNEITSEVLLCNADGTLNPQAIGWGRKPWWVDNLQGRPFRKKRWDYWCFMGPHQLFSLCLADVDYIGLGGAYVLDYATSRMAECGIVSPLGRQPHMPPRAHGTATMRQGRSHMEMRFTETGGVLTTSVPKCGGRPLKAEMHVTFPQDLDTLNVLVPWSTRNFQFTSKQLPLPCEGEVKWGDEVWTFGREDSFGVRDYGRGIWPYSTNWNWAALSGRSGTDVYGLNLGGQWTDHTGATENGLILNGTLHKIFEDAVFEYDRTNFMKPWRLHTPGTNAVDLRMVPFFDRHTHANLGIMRTNVHQCFGHFRGTISTGGHTVTVDNAIGWAEEQRARW
jgi:hypothetical protein